MGPLTRLFRGAFAGRSGFTLVEILVVLIVLALAAGAVVARLERDPGRILDDEARRLAGALEHAAERAQWTGDTLGVSLDGAGYRFWRRDADGRWSALAGSDVLLPHALPPGVRVQPKSYAGAPVPADAIVPFRASGRNEPFAIAVAGEHSARLLTADPLNRVALSGLRDGH